MNNTQRAYFELHIAVVLWGFTAILGHLISLQTFALVWWRVLITCLVILAMGSTFKRLANMPRKLIGQFMLIGCIVVTHWLCFYGAVKLANASVALICMATTSFQSALLEPLILRQPVKWYEVALGIVIVPAMIFIAGSLPQEMSLGFWVGMIGAFLVVIFSILNKKMVEKTDPLSITFLELGGGWLFLTLLMPLYFQLEPNVRIWPTSLSDWFYLIVLSVLCTNLAYWLGVRALKHLSAFATNLTVNLEPVYGMILAVLILGENKELTASFYLGAALILLAVFSYPWLRSNFEKTTPEPSEIK